MATQSPVTIYNASAGTGKTYSLVKNYLKTLISSRFKNKHRHLLAITFTNKAVAEMKERVLSTLKDFAFYEKKGDVIPAMLIDIASETGIHHKTISLKAATLLNEILHNYAAFDIVTIDTFTHRILRTFSRDLDLSGNFEVSLDVKDLLTKAVDRVIDKTGDDSKITEVLVNYALQKTDDNKDWNISRDLNSIAALLLKENDAAAMASMKDKSLDDFTALSKTLSSKKAAVLTEIKAKAKSLLETFGNLGLDASHFNRGTFYNHVNKLAQDPLSFKFEKKSKWQNDIEHYSFYTKSTDQITKSSIASIQEELIVFFKETLAMSFEVQTLAAFQKNIVPLSTLQLINKELQNIKEEENILLISDFNAIIHKSLKDQPAAFIYERIGERYTNYFIDEFQDTSVLQWNNLVPLIENALISENKDATTNSLLIVGDPKQAIYRWRGGKAEQFIDLAGGNTPFISNETSVVSLDKNYRSHKTIVHFNNDLFSHIAQVFDNPTYQEIYTQDNKQKYNSDAEGFVSLQFIDAKTNEDAHEVYPPAVLEIIEKATHDGFEKSDICILIRSNKQGALIAQYLTEQNIQVVSSDSLLIKNSATVLFVEDILTLQDQPHNMPAAVRALRFIAQQYSIEDPHLFMDNWLSSEDLGLYQYLEKLDIHFSSTRFAALPLYEGVEYIIRSFRLTALADAFVIGFLETVFNYSTSQNRGLIGFLEYWGKKKDNLSIHAPLQKDAVQIMTIHKSKGLEFPIVIFPYADGELYSSKNEHHWYDIPNNEYNGFTKLMIGHSETLKKYSEQGEARFTKRHSEQKFDSINVLYVALTRPVQRLYVLSRFRESKIPKYYSDLFINYLKDSKHWEENKMQYNFGTLQAPIQKNGSIEDTIMIPFTSSSKEEHNINIITRKGIVTNEEVEKAIYYGNLVHDLLAEINTVNDIEHALQRFVLDGHILKEEQDGFSKTLHKIVRHPELAPGFSKENTIYNERAILSKEGRTFIPDRVVVSPNGHTTVIDYKTGIPKEEHSFQIENYAVLLQEMNFNVVQKFLVYINEEIKVISV